MQKKLSSCPRTAGGSRKQNSELSSISVRTTISHQRAAAWFVDKLADIENAVDPDQFDHGSAAHSTACQNLIKLHLLFPEKYLSTVTTTQLKKFTPVEEPIVRISHLIWGSSALCLYFSWCGLISGGDKRNRNS